MLTDISPGHVFCPYFISQNACLFVSRRLWKPTLSRQFSVEYCTLHIPSRLIGSDLARLGIAETWSFGEWNNLAGRGDPGD